MANGWVNPKWQPSRERMDRRLEAAGLLNYQTQGMSQEEIAQRYRSAGIRIDSNTNWWKDNYADRPQGQDNLWSRMSTTPKGWGVGGAGTNNGQQPQMRTQPINAPLNQPQQTTPGKGTGVFKPLPVNVTGQKIPAIGETINGITVTKEVQDQLIKQGQGAFGASGQLGQPVPPAQTDYTATDFNWMALSEAQKAQVLSDPNFKISNVAAMGQQGLILSDSQFKLFNQQPTGDGKRAPAYGGSYNPGLNNQTGYGINGDLQWWQPLAFTALSNPKTAPIAQAAAMTLVTGGAGAPTAIGILGLSYIAQLKENDNPVLSGLGGLAEKGMYALNLGAQTAEQVAGTVSYVLNRDEDYQKLKEYEDKFGGMNWIEKYKGLLTPGSDVQKATGEYYKALFGTRISEFISDPALRSAVWNASQSYYETQGTDESVLNKVLETTIQDPTQRADAARAINAFLPLVKDENQVWVLGEAEPVPVKPGYTLDDAVEKILNQGYTTEQVLSEYQQTYGLSGVASDFMLQSVFDPINVADSAVSEGKANIVEGQSQRMIDTGVMTPDQMARVEVNTIKADVYRESPSVNPLTERLPWSETSRKLKASLQTAAQGNAEIAKVLTPWERKLAGLTPDGKIKELLPADASKTGIPKFIDYVFNMTPDSKARLFLDRGASVLQSVFDFSKTADMTPRQMVDLLKASANADMTTLKNAGAEFLSAPEAYTIIGAARDFIPAMEKRAAAFDATAEQRARVTQALEALGDRNVLKNGLTQADWQRLQNNPGALADSIKNGTVTFDSLKKDVAIFQPKKDGTPRVDLSLEEFQARTAAAFDDHVLNWGKDYFGIQKAGQFEEAVRALKGLQSLMLLDISPTSIMNDIINERVMIATRGTLGLTDSGVISKFMDDMGVVNKGDGSTGGLGDAVKNPDPISQLTRADGGLFTKAADAIQQVRSKLPRSKITGATNEAHQSQVRYAEMKKYMTRNWQEGKGFDRMPPSLEAKLREYGYDPQLVYQNLRSTFKPDQIDLLKDRATNMDVNTFIDQAAAKLGKDPQAARETLEQLGALDQLKDGLEKAQTMEQRAQVFDRVSETVVNSIDIRLANQLKGMLENVKNKIKAEGPAGVVQVFQEIPLDYFERKIENDNIWDDAFARAAEVDDYTVKNAIKNKAANDNRAAWRRTQARQAALYMAALEGLDLSREFGRDFMLKLADEQKILQKFFEEKNAKAQQLATKSYKTPEAAAAAWDGFFTQFNERFANDQKKVLEIQRQRNALFVKEMGRMYGQKAEASAAAWMDGVMNNSETMHQSIVEFRKGLQGLPADTRAEAWKQFKPEYQAQWRERMKVDMQGAGNLYKWDENPPYIQDYIDRANVDMEAALKADAERRDAIWQIADEFGYKQDTRDKFKLEGGLRKVEYGGIPDLKGINDPRLTPELMREILTKRAEIKAAEAAMQPDLPTQPIITADAVTNADAIQKPRSEITPLVSDALLQEAKRISDVIGGGEPGRRMFVNGDYREGVVAIKSTYPKWYNELQSSVGGKQKLLAALDKIVKDAGSDKGAIVSRVKEFLLDNLKHGDDATNSPPRLDVLKALGASDETLNKALDNFNEMMRTDFTLDQVLRNNYAEDTVTRYTSEVDALRNELDTFDRAAPDAEQRAIALLERQIELYNAPESLWDTPHNDGTLLDSIQKLNEDINQLVDEASNFERILDNAFEAQENMRTMETHADGLTKREQVQEQLRNTFGEEQGAAVFELADLRAQRWAEMTGRTPEEWYASRVQSVNKGGDTPTLAQFYQEAFHGSPYKFDKFTLDKIGSGEGAQAYGWGLYFAGDKAVGEWYRQKLVIGNEYVNGKILDSNIPEHMLAKALNQENGNIKAVSEYLKDMSKPGGDKSIASSAREALLLLDKGERPSIEYKKETGQLYKVEIPDEGYLLRDKPLSEQPPFVQEAINKLDYTVQQRNDYMNLSGGKEPVNLDYMGNGETFYKNLSKALGGDKAASLALKEAGLSGIKFLDGASRSAGEGNYNYVVFDDSAINILETYYQMNPDGVMAKGGVDFDQYGRATITAMKSADVSTGVHEFAHVFLEDFRRMVDEALPEHAVTIKQDLNTLKNWSSVKQDGNVWRATNAREFTITEEGGKFLYHDPSMPKPMAFNSFEQAQYRLEHELFARGFEKYMRDGKAPTRALGALFARFADWMREIYRSLTGKAVNVDISPPMRDFFNRLLTDYERVDFDANSMALYSDGTIRPKEAPMGLDRVNRDAAAAQADQIVNADVMARAQAEKTRAQAPSEVPTTPSLMQTVEPAYVWQYTRNQYADIANADGGFLESDIERTHRVAVEQAYRAGKDVPEEVLSEYSYLLNPDSGRFNTPEAQATRGQMRQKQAEQYYKEKLRREDSRFYQQAGDVNTPEFKAWFGDSKVVDENGQPLVVYHGTAVAGFDTFKGEMFYFTADPNMANAYAGSKSNSALPKGDDYWSTPESRAVYPVYLSIEKPFDTRLPEAQNIFMDEFYNKYGNGTPLDVERGLPDWTDAESLKEFILEKGYDFDGLILAESHGGITFAAFEPTQIKSVANRGTFDPKNPNILYQQSADTMLPPGGYDQLSGYMDVGKMLYDGWLDEVKPMLDEMKNSAMQPENRYNFAGMDEQTRKQMNLYLADTRGKLATSKNAARRWGDEMVDFTILDYRRQYGFDKLFSSVVPYEFYGTRSALNWATRVMDRPAYLAHFARLQQLHETYESQLPERTRGKVFLPMPFLPEWAGGGTFVDPKFALFPWTQFLQPLDAIKRQNETLNNNASYILRDWSETGQVSQEEAAQAMSSRSGATWEKAIEQAKIDQGENLNTGADYFSMLFGPALYLTVPYYLATGEKFAGINSSYPSGQLPITRVGQALETAFKDTPMEWIGNAAGLLAKPETMAREAMGLPEFGEWGDYYIDRQLANMAAEGTATPEQIQMAMIERKGELYDKAEQRVREELMLRIPGMAPLYGLAHGASFDKVVGSLIPSLFPGGLVPPAEMEYKGLKNEYNQAWKQYEAGNKEAISAFFDEHPEYQARLALRRDPQERIEQFLKSQIWDVYGQLETTDRKSATAQMEGFAEFLDAEPGQSFSVEQLAQWAQQLGAMVPKVEQTMPAFENPAPRINYFAPEITKVTDQFFEERKTLHPDYWKYQSEYYALATKAEKRTYLMSHPQLKAYWDWKDKWYNRYPEYVPVFNGEVFKNVDTRDYPPMLVQMIQMYALTGEEIPTATRPLLEMAWIEAGRPYDSLDVWIDKDLIPSVRNDMMQSMGQQ